MAQNNFDQFKDPNYNSDKALSWDDEIQDTGDHYVILTPGTYPFTVEKFERQQFAGSAKMPPCPRAVITLRVHGGTAGDAHVMTNLFLIASQQWKLAQFFVSLGLMEPGGKLHMPWNKVIGAEGRLELGNHEYNGNRYNDVKKFLPPEKQPAGASGGYSGGYKAGTF